MKTVIDLINEFERGDETVESFNKLFTNNPLLNFEDKEIVTVGEPCSPETTRMLNVGDNSFRHDLIKNRDLVEEFDQYLNNCKEKNVPIGHKEKIHGNTRMF